MRSVVEWCWGPYRAVADSRVIFLVFFAKRRQVVWYRGDSISDRYVLAAYKIQLVLVRLIYIKPAIVQWGLLVPYLL